MKEGVVLFLLHGFLINWSHSVVWPSRLNTLLSMEVYVKSTRIFACYERLLLDNTAPLIQFFQLGIRSQHSA
jgi:hypothetical protein